MKDTWLSEGNKMNTNKDTEDNLIEISLPDCNLNDIQIVESLDMSTMNTINIPDNFIIGPLNSVDTITIDSSSFHNYNSPTISWSDTIMSSHNNVTIDTTGVNIKDNCDIKIGERSLKDFMDRVEDRLAILHPKPELEEKWENLKNLRRQYEELEKDILEKEKIMKILKEK